MMIRSNSPASLRTEDETSILLGNAAFLLVVAFELLRIAALYVGFLPAQVALASRAGELSSLTQGMIEMANEIMIGRAVAELTWFFGMLVVIACLNEAGDRWIWSRIALSMIVLAYAVLGFFDFDAYRIWLETGLQQSDAQFMQLLEALGAPVLHAPDWLQSLAQFFLALVALVSMTRALSLRASVKLMRRGSPWRSTAL